MNTRTNRELETREKSGRASYKPPSTLPVPNARAGMRFRWVRTAIFGNPDNKNASQRIREDWVPVKAEDFPELQIMSDKNSQFPGCVEVGGLLLCMTSDENVSARRKYYEDMTHNQMVSVENAFLRENDPRMPLQHAAKSRVTRGQKPQD